MFDVTGLLPEARPVALAAAEIYYRHTAPWFVGLVCFGSAVRSDIFPGVSDLDFHVYLDPAAFAFTDGDDNPAESSLDDALDVIGAGVAFLEVVAA